MNKSALFAPLLMLLFFFGNVASAEELSQDFGSHLIIKYKPTVQSKAATNAVFERLKVNTGKILKPIKATSNKANVVSVSERLPIKDLEALAKQISQDPDVEYAEPDYVAVPFAVPNDPQYTSSQWHYKEPASFAGALNLPPAWDITKGDANLVVAVIDTGFRPHVDLEARRVAGYDFISYASTANDGDGRDADATDPGDYCAQAQNPSSSWHGTHVAGTIGAITDNNVGVAGVNWNSKIQHIRVLGVCGGVTSDISDGMRWAAGLSVPGVPDNATPAKVLNLSLGGKHSCTTTEQQAINDVVAAGAVVIVAAGNANGDAGSHSPANCNNVITVAAVGQSGQRSVYSNYGSVVDVAAPGGDSSTDGILIMSTLNAGTNTPGADTYQEYQGTSMATPHVAGVASLMLSANPDLTPAEVESYLKSTARAFPTGTVRDCNTSICGAGLVDAFEAVQAVSGNRAPKVNAGSDRRVNPLASITLNGSATDTDGTVQSYLWSQQSGTSVTLNNATTATANFTAPSTPGDMVFQLSATDDLAAVGTDTVTITVNAPPVADAGPDLTASPTSTVALSGAASTDDLAIASYTWTQTAGTTVTLANANTVSPSFTATGAVGDVFTFKLTVTDGDGFSSADFVSVTIANKPTVDAGPDQYVALGASVNLNATATDNGTISSWAWTQTSGGAVTLSGATTANASFTAPFSPTSLTFDVTVTDNDGLTDTDSVTVYVVNAPVSFIWVNNIYQSSTALVTLDGSFSFSNNGGSIVAYEWEQTAGPTVTLSDPTAVSPTFTVPMAPGETITIQLTVTDNIGARGSSTLDIIIYDAPLISALPDQTVAVNTNPVYLANGVSITTYGGGTPAFNWTQTAGTYVTLTQVSGPVYSFIAPASPTTLVFELEVTDGVGISSYAETRVSVGGMPFANAGPDQTVNPGATVNLTGSSSSDPGGSISAYSWSQLSGPSVTLSGATTATPSFTAPSTAGILIFQLAVTDNSSNTATDQVVISVNAGPTADAGPDQTVAAFDTVSLFGGDSSAAVGSIVNYNWTQTAGVSVSLNGPTSAYPWFTAPGTTGTLTFELTVTDGNGLTGVDTVSVSVSNGLIVSAGADRLVQPGATVNLDVNPVGTTSTLTSFAWSQTAGTSVAMSNSTSKTPSFTAPIASGILSFQITAQDNLTQEGTDTINVEVENVAPVLGALSDVTVALNGAVNFTVTATDANGTTPTLQMSGVPTGATFTPATGVFDWPTASISGNHNLIVRAIDADDVTLYSEKTVVIGVDSKGVLQFTLSADSVSETVGSYVLNVSRTAGSQGDVSVNVVTVDQTATAGSDYTTVSQTLDWLSGDATNKPVTITVTDDADAESSETLLVRLQTVVGGAVIGSTNEFTLTITDDDASGSAGAIRFSAATYTVDEAAGQAAVQLERYSGSMGAVDVAYTTNASSAGSSDYVHTSGNVLWADGEMGSKTILIPIRDDGDEEGDEIFNITLSTSDAATLDSTTASILIKDNDVKEEPKCFIATAAFGSGMESEVRYLRAFRDEYLKPNSLGKTFVDLYYTLSPPVARFIAENDTLRSIVRAGLAPLIAISKSIVSDEGYEKQTADKE
ncbi:MAG: S8 family serine peptidase [Gammaproteobacteria bacterium]|nr:S8 family serine peptidase [Gammaproteobacteria bacterium]